MLRLTMVQKLWLTVSCAVIVTVSLLYAISLYSYERLYVQHIEHTLLAEGKRLAAAYGGDAAAFEKEVQSFDALSQAEVLFVSNPRDLSACLPFDIPYRSIITEQDREQLLKGDTIARTGYEERFSRSIQGVIIPILDGKQLAGILYSYIPLKSITDVMFDLGFILTPLAIGLIILTAWLARKIVLAITKPLVNMERVSYQMAKGDFTERLPITSQDEIGKLAAALNTMAGKLQKEDLQRKEFLANVSHELRTPLSYMKGYTEAMLDGVSKPEQQQRILELMQREAGRMQRLVRDLLDLAQLEGDLFPLNQQPLVLAQLLDDVLETYEPTLEEKGIGLSKQLDYDIIASVDEDRLQQVVHNVMTNAIRYTAAGGHISVSLSQQQTQCTICIADTGIGIAPEHIAHLGERFYRVDQARSRQSGGTGLGLAIVKQIIESHGGTVTITSEEGAGTAISISLPVIE